MGNGLQAEFGRQRDHSVCDLYGCWGGVPQGALKTNDSDGREQDPECGAGCPEREQSGFHGASGWKPVPGHENRAGCRFRQRIGQERYRDVCQLNFRTRYVDRFLGWCGVGSEFERLAGWLKLGGVEGRVFCNNHRLPNLVDRFRCLGCGMGDRSCYGLAGPGNDGDLPERRRDQLHQHK